LKANGISDHAIDNLVKSQQFITVINGVYKRDRDNVEWGNVIYLLQQSYHSDLTLGGLST
jgi:hypothetical protein